MNLPPYKNFPTITNGKISLRKIVAEDMNDLIEISFYDSVQAKTLQQAIEMQAEINRDYVNGDSIHWGIEDVVTNKLVGTCGYYRGFNNGVGELGCILLPQYRGQGYMTSAMFCAIEFGLKIIGLEGIRAVTSRDNFRAIKLLARLQFIEVGDRDSNSTEFELRQHTQ